MQVIVLFVSCFAFSYCGVIHDHKGHQATSFQSIHMEHFHAVPTYVKKEDMHYLKHPVSEGKTEAKVEVHHGSKHDPGYAVANIHSEIYGHHGGHQFVAAAGVGHSYDGHQNSDDGKHYDSSYHGQDEGHEDEQPRQQYSYEAHDGEEGGGESEDASYQYQAGEGQGLGSYEQHGRIDEGEGEHY